MLTKSYRKRYDEREIEYLMTFWGEKPLVDIARALNRTTSGIQAKAKKLRLGGILNAGEYLTARQVGCILGRQPATIIRWIKYRGLKGKYKLMLNGREKGAWRIKYDDLWKWLENNQKCYDARKIIPYSLGIEPQWLKEKRLQDITRWGNNYTRWTQEEEKILLDLYHSGETLDELAKRFGRTRKAIDRKLNRIIHIRMGIKNA